MGSEMCIRDRNGRLISKQSQGQELEELKEKAEYDLRLLKARKFEWQVKERTNEGEDPKDACLGGGNLPWNEPGHVLAGDQASTSRRGDPAGS